MARPSSRFAVCAGVAVAVLLIGAPGAAVAVADPGGSGAHSNHADGGNQSDRGGNTGGHQSDRGGNSGGHQSEPGGNSAGGRAADQTPNLGNTGPRATAGTARSDTVSGNTSSDQVAEPSAPQGSTTVDGSAATPEAPAAPPVVRFGDGRSPRYEQPVDPPGQSGAPAVVPVQAPSSAVVATPPGRSWIERHLSPSALLQLDGGGSGPLTDPLLGLAGLVLLPAAAAVLGYRQAKAAQAARALGRP